MYAHVARRVRARDLFSMNRSLVGIPFLGARNPHCPEYPLIHDILVGIPSSGDPGGYRLLFVRCGKVNNVWFDLV